MNNRIQEYFTLSVYCIEVSDHRPTAECYAYIRKKDVPAVIEEAEAKRIRRRISRYVRSYRVYVHVVTTKYNFLTEALITKYMNRRMYTRIRFPRAVAPMLMGTDKLFLRIVDPDELKRR